MLVSGFPDRGYLNAASPVLMALCTCELFITLISFGNAITGKKPEMYMFRFSVIDPLLYCFVPARGKRGTGRGS